MPSEPGSIAELDAQLLPLIKAAGDRRMIGRLPDLLAALPLRQRLQRERDDAFYLMASREIRVFTASRASLKRDAATWPWLIDGVGMHNLPPYQPGGKIDFTVCARVDLDHPIYFADNRFVDCADCGCDLQHRPDAPSHGVWLCVCCAARRVRGF